jgi:hypothetical protein
MSIEFNLLRTDNGFKKIVDPHVDGLNDTPELSYSYYLYIVANMEHRFQRGTFCAIYALFVEEEEEQY